MSTPERVRRAETLRRVAELRQQQALVGAVNAAQEASRRRDLAAAAADYLAAATNEPIRTAADLQAKRARLSALAASAAQLSRYATEADLSAAAALDDVHKSTVVVKGRERLVDRRREELNDVSRRSEQSLLDEIAARYPGRRTP